MDTRPTAEVKPPAEPVIRAASLLAPGRALDIACGTGRHAIWLHENGWNVTAVDRDVESIAGIRRDCPAIDARVVDLEKETFAIDAPYDLVICWLYHQRDLYPVIRCGLRPGGVAAMSARMSGRFAADPGELRRYFPGWTILHEADTAVTQTLVCQRPVK